MNTTEYKNVIETLSNISLLYRKKTAYSLSTLFCISRCSKTAKIKLFINYKREMYALAHLNLSTANFKCLS